MYLLRGGNFDPDKDIPSLENQVERLLSYRPRHTLITFFVGLRCHWGKLGLRLRHYMSPAQA